MLVPFVHAVAWEVLDGSGDSVFLDLFHIRFSEPGDAIGIRPERPGVGDGIAEIVIDVNNGGKRPVDAERRSLFPDNPAQLVRIFLIVCRRNSISQPTRVPSVQAWLSPASRFAESAWESGRFSCNPVTVR